MYLFFLIGFSFFLGGLLVEEFFLLNREVDLSLFVLLLNRDFVVLVLLLNLGLLISLLVFVELLRENGVRLFWLLLVLLLLLLVILLK